MKRLTFWIVVLFALSGLSWYKIKVLDADKVASPTGGATGAGKTTAVPVRTIIAVEKDVDEPLFSSGTLHPNEETELRVETSGRIKEIHFKEGQWVKKGMLLMQLNDDDLQAQLLKLQNELTFAQENERRSKKLLDGQAIGTEEYEQMRHKIAVLEADRQVLQVQLAKTQLLAPFDGVIGVRTVAPGAYIQTGASVAPLRQVNPIKLEFTLPERYAGKVGVGKEIFFKLEGSPKKYTAKISLIDPIIDANTRSMQVRAISSNAQNQLIAGGYAYVEVPVLERQQIMVPSEAIVPVPKGRQVYIVKNGKAVPADVTTGLRTANEVQVTQGLSVGDSVIISGLAALRPGSSVFQLKD